MTPANIAGEEQLLRLCNIALEATEADQAQVSCTRTDSSLTRFANSSIHQNVMLRDCTIAVKVAVGKRIGIASTNSTDEDSIRQAAQMAVKLAKNQPENPDFVSLPGPDGGNVASAPKTFFEETAALGPEERAAAVADIVDETSKVCGGTATGSLAVRISEEAVANSLGIRRYAPFTRCSLVVVAQTDEGVSHAERHTRNAGDVNFREAAAEAARLCKMSEKPKPVEPGEYDVVLLPDAVADMVSSLGWAGCGAQSLQDGRSFMKGKQGQQIVSERVSVWDNAQDERSLASPFDGEGVTQQRVEIITDGVAKGVVYDSYTAGKEGRASTGHGSGGPLVWGPYPRNLFLGPGEASVEEMIASTKRGLLVNRFHYTNILEETQVVFTGMTRDGIFLIEDGKVTRPVCNMRFTESILRALSNVEALGRDLQTFPGVCAPAAKIRSFRFTSATEF